MSISCSRKKRSSWAKPSPTQIADEIRRGGRVPIEDLAKKFNMTTGEAKLVEANQPLPELGNAPGLMDNIFHQRVGDVSAPIHTDLGYVVISVKDIQPTHPATLAEVHDRVASDYRHEKAVELAKSRAEELAKRAKGGENFAAAAKALGLDVKTSEPISRTGSIPDVGSAKQFAAAFTLPVGQTGDPIPSGRIGRSIGSRSTIPSIRTISRSKRPKSKSRFCSASGKPPTICSEPR